MFCAQMIGKPVTAPDPTAAPTPRAVPLSSARRDRPTPFPLILSLVIPKPLFLQPGHQARVGITKYQCAGAARSRGQIGCCKPRTDSAFLSKPEECGGSVRSLGELHRGISGGCSKFGQLLFHAVGK